MQKFIKDVIRVFMAGADMAATVLGALAFPNDLAYGSYCLLWAILLAPFLIMRKEPSA